jgi:transcriptional regulator with XRE-family HTH domain
MQHSDRPQPALGKAIRQLREKRGATQEGLGQDAGVTGRTLSLIEQGHANPKWATVRDIADALGISMGDLAKLADRFAASENATKM